MRAHVAWSALVLGCVGSTVAPVPIPAPPPAMTAPKALPPLPPIVAPAGYVEVKPLRIVRAPHGPLDELLLLEPSTDTVLSIYIGGTEGASIELRLRGETPLRPLTHDLLDDAVKTLNGTIVKVQVDELRNDVFHGSIYVRTNRQVLRLDARPSDAVALAIGNSVPIYCAERVLLEVGKPREQVDLPTSP